MTDAKKNRLANIIISVAISLAAVYFVGNVVTFYMPSASEVSSTISGSSGTAGAPTGGHMPPSGGTPPGGGQ